MKRTACIRGLAWALALAALFAAGTAFAKPKIVMKEMEIKGKIIRPEMSLILQRSKINYDALKLSESFLPRIVRSVQQDPF